MSVYLHGRSSVYAAVATCVEAAVAAWASAVKRCTPTCLQAAPTGHSPAMPTDWWQEGSAAHTANTSTPVCSGDLAALRANDLEEQRFRLRYRQGIAAVAGVPLSGVGIRR